MFQKPMHYFPEDHIYTANSEDYILAKDHYSTS